MHPSAQRSRFLRLAASALASLGLLGHGFAMLLVSLLGDTPVAAQSGAPAFVEICTADGFVKPAASGSGSQGGPADSRDQPARPDHDAIDSCPPASLTFAELSDNQTAPLPADGRAIKSSSQLYALSRGPPTSA